MSDVLRPKVGLGVVVVKDGRMLVGKRIGENGTGTWQLPGGHLELHESWEGCARREVLEETGLFVKNVRFLGVTNDPHQQNGSHYITIFMYADYDHGELENREPDKHAAWGWFVWEDIPSPRFKPLENFMQQGIHPLATPYNKLVRDHIPEIIEERSQQALWHTAGPEEYRVALKAKLVEEVTEYLQSEEVEELADILEVVNGLQALSGTHREQLQLLQKQKRDQHGGFETKTILDETRPLT